MNTELILNSTYKDQSLTTYCNALLKACKNQDQESFKSTIGEIKNSHREEYQLAKILGYIDEGGKNLFLQIISMANPDIVQILLNEGIILDAFKDSEGKTALMHAIEDYEYSTVETLIKNGSDTNFKIYASGITPMSLAIYHGQIEIVKLLIAKGAKLSNIKNELNILQYSAMIHDESGTDHITKEILNILHDQVINDTENSQEIKKFIKESESSIYIIVKYNNPKILKTFLEEDILDSNNNNNLSIIGCSPLIYAAQNDKIDEAKILLDFGANITATDIRGIDAKTHIERLLIKFLEKLYSEDRKDFNKRIKNLEELITQSEASEGFEYKEDYKIRIDSTSAEKIIDGLQLQPSCFLGPAIYASKVLNSCLKCFNHQG